MKPKPVRASQEVDVCVVGAGMAGLGAAAALERRGLRAVLLEARTRVGGRVSSRVDDLTGTAVERGAEFFQGRPPALFALAKQHRLRVLPVEGAQWELLRGKLQRVGRARGHSLLVARRGLAGLSNGVGDQSVAQFVRNLRRREGARVAAEAKQYFEGFYAAPAEHFSARALAGMEIAQDSIDGDAAFRVAAGYQQLPIALARALSSDALMLNAIVTRIDWKPGRVRVHARTAEGTLLPEISARALVLTLPIGVLNLAPEETGAIRIWPRPEGLLDAAARLRMGPILKVLARFRRPFWHSDSRLRASSFFFHPRAAVPTWWVGNAAGPSAPSRALVGWAAGPAASALAGVASEVVLAGSLQALGQIFSMAPNAVAALLDRWEVVSWTDDPFARGGYAYVPTGQLAACEALARPVAGTLFVAGEGTNPDGHGGTVHGALESGRRAAAAVVASFAG